MFHMHWMSCLALADFIIIFGLKFFSICPLIFKTGKCVKTEGTTGGRLTESFCFINVTNDPSWLSTSCLTFDLRRALGRAASFVQVRARRTSRTNKTWDWRRWRSPRLKRTGLLIIPDQHVIISNSDPCREAAFLWHHQCDVGATGFLTAGELHGDLVKSSSLVAFLFFTWTVMIEQCFCWFSFVPNVFLSLWWALYFSRTASFHTNVLQPFNKNWTVIAAFVFLTDHTESPWVM